MEAATLEGEVTLAHKQREAILEERDNLRTDIENSHLAKDEIVKKVRTNKQTFIIRRKKMIHFYNKYPNPTSYKPPKM